MILKTHITITYNELGNIMIYINGTLFFTINNSDLKFISNKITSKEYSYIGNQCQIYISEIKFFNQELTADNVLNEFKLYS